MAKTLFFEEVTTATVVTTNTVTPFPKRPTNNADGSAAFRYQYQVGRDGQTSGNYLGDVKGHIPACPYHMPRNSNRYNDPRMFLPYKKRGDIIEANDLNKLYDRLNVFLYAWNAEINDVYSLGIVNKLRSPAAKNFGNLIDSEKKSNVPFTITNSNGSNQNKLVQNKVYFQMYKSDTLGGILNKFNDITSLTSGSLIDESWLTNPIGSILPYGIPKIIGVNGEVEKASFKIATSEENNNNINLTLTNQNFKSTRPQCFSDYLFNFGRSKNQNTFLEYFNTVSNINYYKFVIDRDVSGNPVYLSYSQDAGATYTDLVLSDDINEFIYTQRDYNEDPLDPKLYYYGIKIFSRPLDTQLVGQTYNTSKSIITISENDITYDETDARFKKGNYPIIKAQEWKNARLTIKTLLDRILSISTVAFSGQIDTVTKFEIDTFYSQQTGFAEEVNKDDPEALFLSYQAVPGAIIKVEFYNTLVDAYKLMVNSCICNTDCSCNINCVCNVNCGCNYG